MVAQGIRNDLHVYLHSSIAAVHQLVADVKAAAGGASCWKISEGIRNVIASSELCRQGAENPLKREMLRRPRHLANTNGGVAL
jgi:hypothetical protein